VRSRNEPETLNLFVVAHQLSLQFFPRFSCFTGCPTQPPCNFGQLLRTEKQKGYQKDDQQLASSDAEHRLSPCSSQTLFKEANLLCCLNLPKFWCISGPCATKFLQMGEAGMEPLLHRKREAIARMFSIIAPKYDLLNRLLSGFNDIRWRRFAVEWLPVSAKIVVDIGTGTGDFAFAVLDRCSKAKVIGVDLSTQMLKLAQRKAVAQGRKDSCSWLIADGLNLPFRDESADAVVCAFVIRNFEDLTKGLTEMHRILKPNGVALILEFCQPKPSWWWTPVGLFVRYVVPIVGRLVSDPVAYSYLTASIQTFLPAEAVAEKMKAAGFREVAWATLTFGVATFFRAVK
jgi:demethylmenaquinone methyltransferase/2-methoxy-6-polyprenyl-1,4-benzoquinol methylase